MHKIAVFAALAASCALAAAQEQGRVLSVTPVVQQVAVPRQVCGNETVYTGNRTTGAGAVIGAIAGGAAGNTIGRGSGRAAATAIGVLGGAVVGNQIEGGQPQYQTVQRCNTETWYDNRTVGYDVVYEYAGRQYTTRTQTDPGRWIAVNVQPAPGYVPQPSYAPAATVYNQSGVVSYPAQSGWASPPATVIEYGYGYDSGRTYYPAQRSPYVR